MAGSADGPGSSALRSTWTMFRGRLEPAGGTTVIRQRPGSPTKEKIPLASVDGAACTTYSPARSVTAYAPAPFVITERASVQGLFTLRTYTRAAGTGAPWESSTVPLSVAVAGRSITMLARYGTGGYVGNGSRAAAATPASTSACGPIWIAGRGAEGGR